MDASISSAKSGIILALPNSLYSPSRTLKPLSDVCALRLIPNFKAVDSDWFFHVLVWAPCVQVPMLRNAQNQLSHKSLKLGMHPGASDHCFPYLRLRAHPL